jgi:hypothetical protein
MLEYIFKEENLEEDFLNAWIWKLLVLFFWFYH